MWSVLLLVGLTKAVSFVAGIASVVDEKSGEFLDIIARNNEMYPRSWKSVAASSFFQLESRVQRRMEFRLGH